MTKELFTREELIKMLDDWGVEYEFDSPTPGIGLPDGTVIPWDDESLLPSNYFKAIDERTIELPEGLRSEEEMIKRAQEENNELH